MSHDAYLVGREDASVTGAYGSWISLFPLSEADILGFRFWFDPLCTDQI